MGHVKDSECENCGLCRFWKKTYDVLETDMQETHWGECHRNPPVPFGKETYFPTTKSTNWCGEFKTHKSKGGN